MVRVNESEISLHIPFRRSVYGSGDERGLSYTFYVLVPSEKCNSICKKRGHGGQRELLKDQDNYNNGI